MSGWRIRRLRAALLLALPCFLALAGYEGRAEGAEARVFFIEPKDGAVVKGAVKVVMGLEGMTIKPSGKVVKGTGHHHVLVNRGAMRKGKVIPTDKTHLHYGKGQTEASIKLAPGDYRLTMQFADGLHRSYGPRLSATIRVRVLPGE